MKRFIGVWCSLLLLRFGVQLTEAQTCNSTVTGMLVLTSDLNCPVVGPNTHGLRVAAGATLDCNGYTITGPGSPAGEVTEQYGIYLNTANGATVRNCHVKKFEVGIRVRQSNDAVIEENTSEENRRYGIEVTRSSSRTRVEANVVQNNLDEGVHISGNAPTPLPRGESNAVSYNLVRANAKEGIYLLETDNNTVEDNAVFDQAAAGIYVDAANTNLFRNNTLTNDPIQLAEGAHDNVFIDNVIIDQRIKFDQAPNNTVERLTIKRISADPAIPALQFQGSPNNIIRDSEVCGPIDDHIVAVLDSTDVTFTRFFVLDPPIRASVDATSGVVIEGPRGQPIRCAVTVDIAIKPGSDFAPVQQKSKGVIPVVILTTGAFDAAIVDPATVCFGDADDTSGRDCTERHSRGHLEDVDGDGDLDLVLHYDTQEMSIDPGDEDACLTGLTYDGLIVYGCDGVQVL